jgi:hypothetical protein
LLKGLHNHIEESEKNLNFIHKQKYVEKLQEILENLEPILESKTLEYYSKILTNIKDPKEEKPFSKELFDIYDLAAKALN